MTSIRAGAGLPPVTGMSRVGLHPLRMRRDGEAWVIGRVETGEFISAPPVAQRAISLLSRDQTRRSGRRCRPKARTSALGVAADPG
jgi:hypothetical protein